MSRGIYAPFLMGVHDRLLASAELHIKAAEALQETDKATADTLIRQAYGDRSAARSLRWSVESFGVTASVPVVQEAAQ
ncbi:hypothetical protein [Asaia spathodeae]|uniref:Uncharacterized protein n=1 Tax=Asaia spathodeae TaxID=657016 RepID=A0ABX2P7M3_9PROT|nr:hypothetical protein [Asaia spathodeae]GBR19741.1 hypothetical protein AA105894_2386 [Asaia spathodeae NBRC 105894]